MSDESNKGGQSLPMTDVEMDVAKLFGLLQWLGINMGVLAKQTRDKLPEDVVSTTLAKNTTNMMKQMLVFFPGGDKQFNAAVDEMARRLGFKIEMVQVHHNEQQKH